MKSANAVPNSDVNLFHFFIVALIHQNYVIHEHTENTVAA